ncbi:NLI interacting factor-like phosphatase [Ceratobasidium sp. AG-Ba]|nr:NLI interacting factor-like phosphatase [Ceratobasidium sp. AG-Ba]
MSQPNKTLYIKNLNDQVKKDELKSQLYALFTPYGRILDIVAMKRPNMRGQAFVVFHDLAGATAAMRAWDGELFYDKEMRIEYAKTRSFATRRVEEPGWDPLAEAKAKALGLGSRLKRERDDDGAGGGKKGRGADGEEMDMDDEPSNATAQGQGGVPSGPPSSRLICTNLPPETTQEALQGLFQQYPGFHSVALGPGPTSPTAQVLYQQTEQATVAKNALHGFTLKQGWAFPTQTVDHTTHNHVPRAIRLSRIPCTVRQDRIGYLGRVFAYQTMNTLGYISRQYDALASQPTTPTAEPVSFLSRSQDDLDIRLGRPLSPKAQRTKSLSRTRSSTLLPPLATLPDNTTTTTTAPSTLDHSPPRPRRKRFVLVRLLISIWHGLCALWTLLPAWKRVRHNFGLLALDTSDEKEDGEDDVEEEEDDPLVTRAPPPSAITTTRRISFDNAQVLTKRTSRSRFNKPPTPVASPAELAESDKDGKPPRRTTSLSFTSPSPTASSTAPTRPRASSTLLPNPLSTSLLTPSASALPSRASTPPIRRPTALHKTKTLVLDLDETLIHSTSRAMHSHGSMGGGGLLGLSGLFGGGRRQGAGHMVEVVLGGRSTLYHVYKRPFVDFFLRKVSSWYTLVIFTASMPEYADPVIDWLDAGRGMFSRRFFRESCTQLPSGQYTKDLTIIEQDLSRICLIDNSPASYSINAANGIPIEGWISDPGDEALLDLLPVLDSLRFTSDVRHVLGLRGF